MLEAKSKNEEIRRKQDQLHVLVNMIRDFQADERLDGKAAANQGARDAAAGEAGRVGESGGDDELMIEEGGDE